MLLVPENDSAATCKPKLNFYCVQKQDYSDLYVPTYSSDL